MGGGCWERRRGKTCERDRRRKLLREMLWQDVEPFVKRVDYLFVGEVVLRRTYVWEILTHSHLSWRKYVVHIVLLWVCACVRMVAKTGVSLDTPRLPPCRTHFVHIFLFQSGGRQWDVNGRSTLTNSNQWVCTISEPESWHDGWPAIV